MKIIADGLNGLILGAHIIGPDASSILSELVLCMKHNLPVKAIADTMHAYPSFPEAIEAAALSAPNFPRTGRRRNQRINCSGKNHSRIGGL